MAHFRIILAFLLSFCVTSLMAQQYTPMTAAGYAMKRVKVDSTLHLPSFCGTPTLRNSTAINGALAMDTCNNKLYKWTNQAGWSIVGQLVDTSLYVKYADTASMLSHYLLKSDTASLSNRINLKVNIADTASMLTPYFNKVNYGLSKSGQTISADSATLSLKYLRIVDTSNKWVSSVIKLNDSTIQVIKDGTTTNITLTPASTVTSATRLVTQVYNNSGVTITKGSVIYINGRHSSNLPTIALAQANTEQNSYSTFALVLDDIATSNSGTVVQAGSITNLNLPTSSFTDGQLVYLSPTVAGGITTTKPLAPYHIVKIGTITRAHPTFGTIELKIENGWQLDEMSDVQIPVVPNDSNLLQFSRVDSLWHSVSPTTAIGSRYIQPSDTASMLSPYLRTSTNIYNTNGSFTGARTATFGTYSLTFLKSTAINTFADGLYLKNDVSATASGGAYSPALTFSGYGWGGTSANTLAGIRQYLIPVNGSPYNQPSIQWDGLNTGSTWVGLMTLKARAFGGGSPNAGLQVGNSSGYINLNVTNNQIDNGNTANTLVIANTNGNGGVKMQGGNQYINMNSTVGIQFHNGTSEMGRFFTSTGDVVIQTGGTYTDAGYKLDVNGTARVSGAVGIETSSSSVPFLTHKFSNNQTFSVMRDANYGTMIASWDGSTSTRCLTLLNNSVGVGLAASTIASTAVLDVQSTTKGFLPPRMTTTQRTAIVSPAEGLTVYDLTLHKLYVWDGTAWQGAW